MIRAFIAAIRNLLAGRCMYDAETDEYVSFFGKRVPAGDPLDTRTDKVDDQWRW